MARMLLKRAVWLTALGCGLASLAGCDGTLDPDIWLGAGLTSLGNVLVFLLQNVVAGV